MTAAEPIDIQLDGRPVKALPGETLWDVALREGVEIPHLCHTDGLRPVGNCRACVVEVEGERALSASCCRAAAPGMKVKIDSERAVKARAMVVELLVSDAGRRPWRCRADACRSASAATPRRI
jgi:formate dehydrogenase major subunit